MKGFSVKPLSALYILLVILFSGSRALAQTYDTNGDFVQTFAGSGFSGYVDGMGVNTMFSNPSFTVVDSQSNLFVWDSGNSRIRKISPDGMVTTFAGGGNQTTGVGTNVNLSIEVGGMAIDHDNAIWIITYINTPCLYQITSGASITRTNLSSLSYPQGLCVDSFGSIYISDSTQNGNASKIYRYTTNGALSVFAGSGNPGYADGNGIFTAFYLPAALATDAANNIYVWDLGNNLIRRIDQNQNVTTFAGKYGNNSDIDGAGTNASFIGVFQNATVNSIHQMCCDHAGSLFLACGDCIRKIDTTTNVVTMAGSFTQSGFLNGVAGNLARFNGANGVCLSQGMIFAADANNQRIRNITFNPTSQPVSPANLQLSTYPGLQIIGTVGRTYQIQSSPDTSTWTTRASILLTSSPYLWIDQNPVIGNQFYRALLLP